ncbi:MAG TPA: hypothetical protein VGH98_10660 [Gemmatimonadaceae bacterium]|jgi:hypothetical protein
MPLLHDPQTRATLRSRLESLQPTAVRQWGKMTPDQMLKHVDIALSVCLGQTTFAPGRMPLPGPLFRFFAANFPFPKGAPTHPDFRVSERCDFAAEKARCLTLLDEFARKPIDSAWPESPIFGKVTGKFNSRVQAKHLDHHLRQFGA